MVLIYSQQVTYLITPLKHIYINWNRQTVNHWTGQWQNGPVKNWLNKLIQIYGHCSSKLGGDFLVAIILTVPFTAICWPSDELLFFKSALIKRTACKILMCTRLGDLVDVIMRRDWTRTTFYARTSREISWSMAVYFCLNLECFVPSAA